MQKTGTKKLAIFMAVIGLLIFLHITRVLIPVESFITGILRPLLSGFYSVSSSVRATYNEQTSKEDLFARIKQLESHANQLTVENAKLKMLEQENQILRQYLKFSAKSKQNYVLCNIISRGRIDNPVMQGIIIDRGAKDGLFPGLAVVSGQGIIIGKIIAVKNNIAEVYLITNQACKLAAVMQNQNKTSGIIQGELGLTVRMEFIPQTEKIKIGGLVVTSGLERGIPRGLVIGKVNQIIKESNELWQSAIIEPLVDFDELTIVSVLLP
ncbi:MAG: rod shape-determining protein MreC [Patescibacteria group bacterium]|nr:rod shape-determining protein MreC [Patescibacteria group bacterium]